jgi:hypothetical protein
MLHAQEISVAKRPYSIFFLLGSRMRNPKKARTQVRYAYARRLYVWPPVVLTSSCQCSALAREIKRALGGSVPILGSAWLRPLIHSLVVVT